MLGPAMAAVPPAEAAPDGVTLAVLPGGQPRLVPGSDDGLAPAARAQLVQAFARGPGHGLLQLGAAEAATQLSAPLGFARDVARLFVGRLCGTPDLERLRERATVPPPAEDLERLASAVPPLIGAEYVDLGGWWRALEAAFQAEIREHRGTVQAWLAERSPVWNLCGRICFHLAENRGDEEHPFAFLATYTTHATGRSKVLHAPLSRALESSRRDRAGLLSLLVPVHRAAERSGLIAELVDSGDLYHPLAWTPAEAHRFLREIPALEAAGITVRVPDWWRPRRPPRPEVTVALGQKPAAGLGAEALLDFSVRVTLDGEPLSDAELRALLASADGLVQVRGRWVELDAERLGQVLEHWKTVQRSAGEDGVAFLEGLRLLAGAAPDGAAAVGEASSAPDEPGWSRVVAGEWLGKTLAGLRGPDGLAAVHPGPALHATLRPYQEVGVSWLSFATELRLGVCLADDMGLGKTIQVLATLLVHKERRPGRHHLLVVPASLIANWQAEIARFAPSLTTVIAHPSAGALPDNPDADLTITTYGQVARSPWFAEKAWSLVILDEAQAIKNPGARQTRAVKALRAESRIALTGTPVENRLGDLWSLYDFLQPGLLGSARAFNAFTKKLDNYAPLRRLVSPYLLRRLKTDRSVAADLPEKTDVKAFCGLARAQAALYQRAVDELGAELAAERRVPTRACAGVGLCSPRSCA
jgi:non-specific serine/threonine protein kinase